MANDLVIFNIDGLNDITFLSNDDLMLDKISSQVNVRVWLPNSRFDLSTIERRTMKSAPILIQFPVNIFSIITRVNYMGNYLDHR